MDGASDDNLDALLREIAADPEAAQRALPIRPGDLLAGRFEVQRQLGAGGMGQVLEVVDRRDGHRFAAKVLGRLSPRSISAIKREFRAAAELSSPHLVRLHELCSDTGGRWLFTMEIVDGVPLQSLLAGGADLGLLRSIFRQLALALTTLHRAGMVHSDLKPSNFLVTREELRVVLLDFGLARPATQRDPASAGGTPRYMAPEQARGEPLTEAADWYAFGVVLHEALKGRLPGDLPPARESLADCPDDLAALCCDLLQLRPTDRPTGGEVLDRLGVTREYVPSSPASGTAAPLIGRQPELAALDRAYQRMLEGRTVVALIQGRSGIGKTALAEHFVRITRARGALVLTGRCRERESMSFKTADGVVDAILEHLDGLAEAAAKELLPPEISALTVLFPALRSCAVIARAASARPPAGADPAMLRQQAVGAFVELLRRFRERGPLVVFLDDLQWSDAESAVLLGPAINGPQAVPLLLVGGARTGRGERVPFLEGLTGATAVDGALAIDLKPLADGDARELARHWLRVPGEQVATLARRVAEEAGGHPLFISELAHNVGSTRPEPRTLTDLITARVAALPSPTRRSLEVMAVAGTPLRRGLLRAVDELDAGTAEQVIHQLRAQHLASSEGLTDEHAIDVPHDRLREIILQSIPPVRLRDHHARLAAALRARGDAGPDVLAGHYQAAGELETAGGYWIAAADRALDGLAFSHAADLYQRGLLTAALSGQQRQASRIRLAEALTYAGRGAAAADIYLATAAEVPREQQFELRRRAAEQLLLCGHLDRGLATIESVLRDVGMSGTRQGRHALLALAVRRLRLRARWRRYRARTESELSPSELVRLDVSWTVACSLGAMDFLRGAEFQTRHLLLAIRAGEPRRLLRALTLEAAFAATPGPNSSARTAELLAVADALIREVDDKAAASLLSLIRGIVAYLHGDLSASVQCFEQATAILRQRSVGAIWEMVTAHRFRIASLFFLGRLRDLAALIPPLLGEAEANGNLYASMIFRSGYSVAAWLARDEVDEARQQLRRGRLEWRAKPFQLSHYNMLVGEALLDLYVGDAERALARITEQRAAFREAQLHRISILRVQVWYLHAIAALEVARGLEAQGRPAAALRQEAAGLARRLDREPLARSAGLAALVAAALPARGDGTERAMRLRRAIQIFDQHEMKLFAASARDRLGRLVGGREGAQLMDQARTAFAEQEIVVPHRLMAMLAPAIDGPRRSVELSDVAEVRSPAGRPSPR